jgi:hypothetical protein
MAAATIAFLPLPPEWRPYSSLRDIIIFLLCHPFIFKLPSHRGVGLRLAALAFQRENRSVRYTTSSFYLDFNDRLVLVYTVLKPKPEEKPQIQSPNKAKADVLEDIC